MAARSIAAPSGCIEWIGSLTSGYGAIKFTDRSVRAHRLAYFAAHGDTHLPIDHLCRNRKCVNPEHLEPVTTQENTLRGETLPGINRRKTHCVRGHDLTLAKVDKRGHRVCRQCHAKNNRVTKLRRRARLSAFSIPELAMIGVAA